MKHQPSHRVDIGPHEFQKYFRASDGSIHCKGLQFKTKKARRAWNRKQRGFVPRKVAQQLKEL